MGLDMSLKLRKHPSKGRNKDNIVVRYYIKNKEEIGYELPDINTNKIKYNQAMIKKSDEVIDIYELAYWRKANAIHKWFVDNVQKGNDNCKDYRVSRRNLLNLLELVTDVLDHCELKDGKIRNGYTFKKFLWKSYKKYNKVKGKVLTRKSIKYCQEKLPTQEGFFFGNTDYNEYYYNDLVYTKERLSYILENYNLSKDKIYYSSSW